LAFDSAGNLYAADESLGAIVKFNTLGVSSVLLHRGFFDVWLGL
jgi:hypothetical protein